MALTVLKLALLHLLEIYNQKSLFHLRASLQIWKHVARHLLALCIVLALKGWVNPPHQSSLRKSPFPCLLEAKMRAYRGFLTNGTQTDWLIWLGLTEWFSHTAFISQTSCRHVWAAQMIPQRCLFSAWNDTLLLRAPLKKASFGSNSQLAESI